MSVIGDYLNVSPRDYSLSQVDYHLPSVLRLSRGTTKPVYAPALLYGDSLDTWTPDITRAIANKMTQINNQGITVWLRLLFEMVGPRLLGDRPRAHLRPCSQNGDWMPYGRDPVGFQRVWKEVTDAIRAQSNEVSLLGVHCSRSKLIHARRADVHALGAQYHRRRCRRSATGLHHLLARRGM